MIAQQGFIRLAVFLCAFLGVWLPSAVVNAQHQNMMSQPASGQGDLMVFAAATLKPALDELLTSYKASTGSAVSAAYGPTPMLAKNIVDGAPADVFFSADEQWMDYLAGQGLIRKHTRADIVHNEVVLIDGKNSGENTPVTIGRDFSIAKIVGAGPLALCNPDSHPAGRFGKQRLQELGLWDTVASKIAIVENPQIAALMVSRGDAPAAVVFATDIYGLSGVRIAGTFPNPNNMPVAYPAAVTMSSRHADAAARFMAFLQTPEARRVFGKFGYR